MLPSSHFIGIWAATFCLACVPQTLGQHPHAMQYELMVKTYRVIVENGSGTAFVVGKSRDRHCWLLTAQHVVDGSDWCQIEGLDQHRACKTWEAVSVVVDRRRDLALLAGPIELASQGSIDPRAGATAREGGLVLACGFPRGYIATTPLKLVGYAEHADYPGVQLLKTASAADGEGSGLRPGSSGSAIVDDQMQLIGVAVAGHRDTTIAISAAEVKGFLRDAHSTLRNAGAFATSQTTENP